MKVLLRNTITISLAMMVLIATSGFTVFRHSCNTAKTTEFSFIIPSFECEHFSAESELPPCCCINEVPEEESYETEKCCDTETYLVKADLTFDIQKVFKTIHPVSFSEIAQTLTNTELQPRELNYILISNDLPPPLSGRALLIYLHQLDIPYPTV